jgi:hypothetical protein
MQYSRCVPPLMSVPVCWINHYLQDIHRRLSVSQYDTPLPTTATTVTLMSTASKLHSIGDES